MNLFIFLKLIIVYFILIISNLFFNFYKKNLFNIQINKTKHRFLLGLKKYYVKVFIQFTYQILQKN